jgi:hypothetical protein
VRLQPGARVLYLAQISEEQLVQRLGVFSYWRSQPFVAGQLGDIRQALGQFEQREVSPQMLLLR